MSEYARKTIVNFHGHELEMYMKPNGVYGLSQTQVGEVIGMSHKIVGTFLKSNAPEALPFKGFTAEVVYIGQGNLKINFIPIPLGSAIWVYHGRKGNIKAQALGAGNLVDTLTRLADNAFGVSKTETQYRQEAISNIQNFELMFERLMNPLLDRIEQMDANIKAIAPLVEAGKVATKVYELFPNYEPLFTEVSNSVDDIGLQENKILSEWLYDLGFRDITHGEKITIGRRVSDVVTTGEHDWFKNTPKKGRKRYPEALLPIIKDATLFVLSTRNTVRLIK